MNNINDLIKEILESDKTIKAIEAAKFNEPVSETLGHVLGILNSSDDLVKIQKDFDFWRSHDKTDQEAIQIAVERCLPFSFTI